MNIQCTYENIMQMYFLVLSEPPRLVSTSSSAAQWLRWEQFKMKKSSDYVISHTRIYACYIRFYVIIWVILLQVRKELFLQAVLFKSLFNFHTIGYCVQVHVLWKVCFTKIETFFYARVDYVTYLSRYYKRKLF